MHRRNESSEELYSDREGRCTVTVTDQPWKEIILENEKIPFAIEQGEMVRSFIIQSKGRYYVLIIAAFLKANPTYQKVGIAVDGRTDGNRSMSNQVTGISIKSNYRCSTTVFRNAAAIQDKVRDKLKDKSKKYFILQFMPLPAPALVDSIVFYINGLYRNPESKKLADVMGYTYGKEKLLSITNLTRLDIPQQYGSYEMKNAVFVPPVVSYGKRIIGVVSDDGGMNIIYHFMDDQEEAGERAFFEAANANLRSFLCC